MRKIVVAALVLFALGCVAGAGRAWAGCSSCGSCKAKCNSCTKSACGSCEKKCNSCSKCAKPKCGACNKCGKKSCGGCGSCNKCAQHKCGGCCDRTPVATWGGGTWWNGDACCPPEQCVHEVCGEQPCGCKKVKHPYELCWNGTGLMCDTGCSAFIPCKRKCVTCTTVCHEKSCKDECGCDHVSYEYETVYSEVTRPRTIPWWFNPKGDGNTYLDENGNKIGEQADASGWGDNVSADSETANTGAAQG